MLSLLTEKIIKQAVIVQQSDVESDTPSIYNDEEEESMQVESRPPSPEIEDVVK